MSFELTIQDIPHYTYKDYEIWDGDWELIRGIPYAMAPAPDWKHQNTGGEFVYRFKEAFEKTKANCGCVVLYECDWKVTDDTVVRPDVMIVCEPIEGKYPVNPPALIVEILSPSTVLKDRNTKFNLYQSYGVKYYLVANMERKELELYTLQDNVYKQQHGLTCFNLTGNCSIEVDVWRLLV
ncbi:Uma2 family endonuclease [Foetidibacter luteolus]|uniref:Uma2 family endonuclease n=1 Tax=Foetidibacter luteolus TaxID=2608880 RepID=UPI00129BE19E|nr:Uma2 family endonuclease [Foetidibacter luteolus]